MSVFFDALVLERCRAFVREQSEGEWSDTMIEDDAQQMTAMVLELIKLRDDAESRTFGLRGKEV